MIQNFIAYWEDSDQSETLGNDCSSFKKKLVVGCAVPGKFCHFYFYLSMGTVFTALICVAY